MYEELRRKIERIDHDYKRLIRKHTPVSQNHPPNRPFPLAHSNSLVKIRSATPVHSLSQSKAFLVQQPLLLAKRPCPRPASTLVMSREDFGLEGSLSRKEQPRVSGISSPSAEFDQMVARLMQGLSQLRGGQFSLGKLGRFQELLREGQREGGRLGLRTGGMLVSFQNEELFRGQ